MPQQRVGLDPQIPNQKHDGPSIFGGWWVHVDAETRNAETLTFHTAFIMEMVIVALLSREAAAPSMRRTMKMVTAWEDKARP